MKVKPETSIFSFSTFHRQSITYLCVAKRLAPQDTNQHPPLQFSLCPPGRGPQRLLSRTLAHERLDFCRQNASGNVHIVSIFCVRSLQWARPWQDWQTYACFPSNRSMVWTSIRQRLAEDGTLFCDRAYAMFDEKHQLWNARRSAKVHRIRSTFSLHERTVTLSSEDDGGQSATFHLEDDRAGLDEWLSAFFERPIHVASRPQGFPDDAVATGPTVVSTATLREVVRWFPDLDTEALRRRIRVNLVIDAERAFWEDRLVSDFEHVVAFQIGDVRLEGVSACGRCVVPTRNPETGEKYTDFQKIFLKQRAATFPADVDRTRFRSPVSPDRAHQRRCVTMGPVYSHGRAGRDTREGETAGDKARVTPRQGRSVNALPLLNQSPDAQHLGHGPCLGKGAHRPMTPVFIRLRFINLVELTDTAQRSLTACAICLITFMVCIAAVMRQAIKQWLNHLVRLPLCL